jgi:hypothetical protein
MSLPQFSAEVSLYETRGHYQTHAGARLAGSIAYKIYPMQTETMIDDGGGVLTLPGTEIITVHSCPPGYEDQGGQCVPVGGWTLTFTDGGENQGGGGTASGGGKKRGNGRDGGDYNPVEGAPCCGGSSMEHGSYHFSADDNQWGCQQKYPGSVVWGSCVEKSGSSEYCKDGWCFPVASLPPIAGIRQG